MNANELADELENKPLAYGNDIQEWLSEAATMLRQQQAEIEALKKQNSAMANALLGFGMTSVTWIGENE